MHFLGFSLVLFLLFLNNFLLFDSKGSYQSTQCVSLLARGQACTSVENFRACVCRQQRYERAFSRGISQKATSFEAAATEASLRAVRAIKYDFIFQAVLVDEDTPLERSASVPVFDVDMRGRHLRKCKRLTPRSCH